VVAALLNIRESGNVKAAKCKSTLLGFRLGLGFRLALIVSLATILTGGPLLAWADTGPNAAGVDIEVKAGFGGLAVSRLGGWVPFRVIITNQGPPISGRLVVFAEAPSQQQSREFSEDVQLPTGSRKFFEIEAFLNSTQVEPVVRLIQHSSSGDKVVMETPVKIEREAGFPGDLVEIAVVDVDDTALSSINSIPLDVNHVPFTANPTGGGTAAGTGTAPVGGVGAGGATAAQAPITTQPGPRHGPRSGFGLRGFQLLKAKPVVIGPSELPRGFGSYDLLDAVVLGDAPVNQLDPEQTKALRLWVAAGGLLIVTGGADFSGLRPAGLDSLMPVDVFGTEAATGLPELTGLYGAFESSGPLLITKARPRPGSKVLIGTAERPLVVDRGFGKGSVRFVGLDPKHNPFRGWSGSASVWQDILLPAAQSRQGRFPLANVGSQMSGALYDMAKVKPPSAGHLLLFLLFYLLVVGPVNYFGLRWVRKTDLAWLTIPVVVVVFTGFSIVAAQTSRGSDLVAASISGVEIYQQEGLARTTSDVLLVFPSKNLHQVTFDRDALINDASLMAGGDPIQTSYRSNETALAIPTDKWAPMSFRVREMQEGHAPVVSIEGADSAPVGGYVKVKNLTNFPITRAVVTTRAGLTDPFDLGPGDEQQCQIKAAPPQTFSMWYSSQLSPGSPEAQVVSYLAPSYPYSGGATIGGDLFGSTTTIPDLIAHLDRPILVGLGENEEPRFGYQSAVKRSFRQMFVVHL
jgi:hypothetical protein